MDYSEACKVLEIEENLSEEEINKKFKKLFAKNHPDKNKDNPDAEKKAKELSEAFTYLKDNDFKKPNTQAWGGFSRENVYDQAQGNDFHDFFNSFMDQHVRQQAKARRPHNQVHLSYNLDEILSDGRKTFEYARLIPCKECNGEKCDKCNNKGTVSEKQTLNVNVQPTTNRQQIIYQDLGDYIPEHKDHQNLAVFINVSPSKKGFILNGYDITTKKSLTLLEALKGLEIDVETIHGKKKVRLPPKVQNGKTVLISGYGIQKRGNHRIEISVEYPENTDKLIEFLENKEK